MHISLHQICDNINIFKPLGSWRLLDIHEPNNVLMVEELQQFDFSNDSFCVDQIFESFWDFFDGNFCFNGVVKSRTYHSVSAMSNLLDIFILVLAQESGTCTVKLGHTLGHLGFDLLGDGVFVLALLELG